MKGSARSRHVLLTLAWAVLAGFPAFSQLNDTGVYVPPGYASMQPPDAGSTYTDPVFGTTVKRISNALQQANADAGGKLVYITDEYSTMSPFNADDSRVLALCQSYFALYDRSGKFVRNLPLEISAGSEPRWSRTSPEILYFVRGNQLKQHNTETGATTLLHTFSKYASVSGKGESDISFDGDHFVLIGDNRYVFVYEIGTGTSGPSLDTGGRAIDSLYITPDDNITITWLQAGEERYSGIELFDRNMNFKRQVSRVGGHMDVTRDSNGEEVLIMTNSADPEPKCDNAIVKIRLSDGQQTCLLSLDWSLAVHVSAPDESGWCFVETYAPADPLTTPGWTRYTNEILQVKLDGSEVRRLAHHRSRPFNSYNYQPHVSVSHDGTVLVYNSNFGLQSMLGYPKEYADMYLIDVPEAGTPDGGTGSGGTGTGTGAGGSTSGSTKTVYQETDAAVSYSGAWYKHAAAMHDGGAARLAMDAGSRATITFNGDSVTWTGYQDEWSGTATVFVDGVFAATVDTYASPAVSRATLFSRSGLGAGSHTLTIQVTGLHNPRSAGSWIWLDAITCTAPTQSGTKGTGGDSSVPGDGTWYIKPSTGGRTSVLRSPGTGDATVAIVFARPVPAGPAGAAETVSTRPGSPLSGLPGSSVGRITRR